MSRIYKQSDRIELSFGDIKIKVKPLSYSEKTEIQSLLVEGQTEKNVQKLQDATILSLRYALKSIEGVIDSNDEPYQLQFEEDGKLSLESVEDLCNMELSAKLLNSCASFISGVPTEEALEELGIKLEKKRPTKKSSKKT
jgi:hypothetical protein